MYNILLIYNLILLLQEGQYCEYLKLQQGSYQGMAQFTLLILITLYLLGSVIGEPQIAPQLFLNRLNISYGINYKYNGQLNHNIDRVWVVTKIKIPSFEEYKVSLISHSIQSVNS